MKLPLIALILTTFVGTLTGTTSNSETERQAIRIQSVSQIKRLAEGQSAGKPAKLRCPLTATSCKTPKPGTYWMVFGGVPYVGCRIVRLYRTRRKTERENEVGLYCFDGTLGCLHLKCVEVNRPWGVPLETSDVPNHIPEHPKR
jgi:hypothetical protein